MAAYTAADVKALREKTGAGMMDCKKALADTDGDIEAAVDALRAKGLAAAQKKVEPYRRRRAGGSGRCKGTRGVAVEVNSETDFVAKNEQFQQFVRQVDARWRWSRIPTISRRSSRPLIIQAAPRSPIGLPPMSPRSARISSYAAMGRPLRSASGLVVPYMHNAAAPNLGQDRRAGGARKRSGRTDVLEPLGKQLAMHIAAAFPAGARCGQPRCPS